jgi:hypothetical protein
VVLNRAVASARAAKPEIETMGISCRFMFCRSSTNVYLLKAGWVCQKEHAPRVS